MSDNMDLLKTIDGKLWAEEWVRIFLKNHQGAGAFADVAWMHTWFANAIETGRAYEHARLLGNTERGIGQHQFHKILLKDRLDRTEVDKVMIAAVMLLSTKEPFTKMTPEEVFDHFVEEHDQIYRLAQ